MNDKISDIDRIVPVSHDRMVIFFKDDTSIETTDIDFNDDGTFELGYIYQ